MPTCLRAAHPAWRLETARALRSACAAGSAVRRTKRSNQRFAPRLGPRAPAARWRRGLRHDLPAWHSLRGAEAQGADHGAVRLHAARALHGLPGAPVPPDSASMRCTPSARRTLCGLPDPSPLRQALLDEMHTGIGHVNLYNVYGQCISGREAAATAAATTHKIPYAHNFLGSSLPRVGGPDACIDSIAGSAYFNQARRAPHRLQPRPPSRLRPLLSLRLTCPIGASVQPAVLAAAHVKKQPFPWSTCGNQIHYTSTRKNLPRDTYPALIARLRVVIYNGDWDACVPHTDAEACRGVGKPTHAPRPEASHTRVPSAGVDERHGLRRGGAVAPLEVQERHAGRGLRRPLRQKQLHLHHGQGRPARGPRDGARASARADPAACSRGELLR